MDFKNSGQRYARRAKRRKTNIILNTMIAIVIILILIVGGKIFFGGENKDKEQATGALTTENNKEQSQEDQSQQADKQTSEDKGADTDENIVDDEPDEENDEIVSDEIIETESDENNVEKVIVNPGWKPIGTEQTSGHQSSWTPGTVDWNEKLQAAAYATDIPVESMIPWWVARGDNPDNQAVLTVSAKGSSDFFRVYIDWIDGEGWKPTVVKKLIENDRPS